MSKHWRILGVLATQRSVHPYFDIEQKSTVQVFRNFYAEGDTLSDAIRNAGVRCETCEHYHQYGNPEYDEVQCREGVDGITPDFFCAHHSALAEDEK